MNVTRWAILALANMLVVYAILGAWHSTLLDLDSDASPPVAIGLTLMVLTLPLMPLAALDLGTLFWIMPAVNSLVWAAFWEGFLLTFVNRRKTSGPR